MTLTTNHAHRPTEKQRPARTDKSGKTQAEKPRAHHLPPGQLKKDGIAYFGWCFAEGTSQEDIFVADPATGAVARITDDSHNPVFTSDRDPAWSPDRKLIAIHRASDADPESRLYLLRAKTGQTVETLVPGFCPEWYDDRTLLFLQSGFHEDPATGDRFGSWLDVFAVDVETLQVTQVTDLEASSGMADTMSWHPTSGLAFGYTEPDDATGELSTSQVMTVSAAKVDAALHGAARITKADLQVAIDAATSPDWSPDGTRLAHVYLTTVPYPEPWLCEPGDPCTMQVGDVAVKDLTTGATVRITSDGPDGRPYGDDFGGQSPAFSPDGSQVAFTKGYEDSWQEIWLSPSTSSAPVRLTDEGRQWFKGGLDW